MTDKKSEGKGKESPEDRRKKPRIKKDTLKDLDSKGERKVQGGGIKFPPEWTR